MKKQQPKVGKQSEPEVDASLGKQSEPEVDAGLGKTEARVLVDCAWGRANAIVWATDDELASSFELDPDPAAVAYAKTTN